MALPAFQHDFDYSWLIETMMDKDASMVTGFLSNAFSTWRTEPGERSYHDMYGDTVFFPTEPYDDGGGACLAGIRYQHCGRDYDA